MPKATWQGTTLADSNEGIVVEGNYYFPPHSVRRAHLRSSETHTTCHWKGEASYYDIEVNGQINKDAAWYYSAPKDAAKSIAGYVAFWKGVEVGE